MHLNFILFSFLVKSEDNAILHLLCSIKESKDIKHARIKEKSRSYLHLKQNRVFEDIDIYFSFI